jgi:putative ABC transport system substrate-binding protein
MRRRDFIKVIAGSAVACPFAARAQQPAIPVIGFLNSGSATERTALVAAFWRGLNAAGYVEGQNVAIEYRWAEGQYDRLAALAADLVRRQVAVIVATGGLRPALAAKAVTGTIPIVFTGGGDPVQLGLVANLSRPGGNATGAINLSVAVAAKRLGLLHDLVPNAPVIGMLVNPSVTPSDTQSNDVQLAARALGLQTVVLTASSERDFDPAFATLTEKHAGALYVVSDPFFVTQRDQIVALAARHALPAIYGQREFATAGGLMSYGTSLADGYRQAGIYTGRILKGAKPRDLPVVQLTRFELVINLKTARALGFTIRPDVLSIADDVIE